MSAPAAADLGDVDVVLNPLITDMSGLYTYSGMLDQLRDTARILHTAPERPDARVVRELAERYTMLRKRLIEVLAPEVLPVMNEVAPWIDSTDQATIDLVFMRAADLARYADLVHTSPQFLLQQHMSAVAQDEATVKVRSILKGRSPQARSTDGVGAPGGYV